MDDTATANLQELTLEECFDLLASASIGRVAVARPGEAPLVVPVNFTLDDQVVMFRTGPGSKLDTLREHPASFQVDCVDPYHRTGWSVLVTGFAYESAPSGVGLDPWDPGPKEYWVRIVAETVTGRRITLAPSDLDPRGYR